MKRIYICARVSGTDSECEENLLNAKIFSQEVFRLGHLPICVHLFLESATGLDQSNGQR